MKKYVVFSSLDFVGVVDCLEEARELLFIRKALQYGVLEEDNGEFTALNDGSAVYNGYRIVPFDTNNPLPQLREAFNEFKKLYYSRKECLDEMRAIAKSSCIRPEY